MTNACIAFIFAGSVTYFCYSQGVRAVIAESYERIHRSNLVGMGIIPMQYMEGQNATTIGLTGKETFTINLPEELTTGMVVTVQVLMIYLFFIPHTHIFSFLHIHL